MTWLAPLLDGSKAHNLEGFILGKNVESHEWLHLQQIHPKKIFVISA
jgi:hypothetical protein